MDPHRAERLEELFGEAIDLAPEERRAFVDEACRADAELRAELESLLAADAEAGPFLSEPAETPLSLAPLGKEPALNAGMRIGAYEIVRPIAAGGMGSVFEAVQESPRRTVALKLMRTGLASPSSVRRFQYESEVLGRLSHPGIARVFEAGIWKDGPSRLPFFALEYVPGATAITRHASQAKLDLDQRLELFARVCDAVQHGHQRGVIHRDLKPANILVDAAGDPKVIDFGVARATDADVAATTLLTEAGELVGTLQYMSPEQCEAAPDDLDTRSDVYALGLVLYELMCEQRPYDVTGRSLPQALRTILEAEPRPPSEVRRSLPDDLETIALKALEKERDRRYGSAAELARDVRLFLAGAPIHAKRDSGWYVLTKTLKQHKLPVAGALGLALVVVIALIVSVTFWRDAIGQRDQAGREAQKYKRSVDFLSQILFSVTPDRARGRDTALLREIFDEAAGKLEAELGDAPDLRAAMQDVIGLSYRALGSLEPAEELLSAALAYYRAKYGSEHPETLGAIVDLAHVYFDQRRLDEAEVLTREALAIAEALEEETDLPQGLRREDLTMNLASNFALVGRTEEAEELYRRSLEVARRSDPEGLSTMYVAQSLGALLKATSRWSEAEELLRDAIEVARRVHGDTSEVTLKLFETFLEVLVELGHREEAAALGEEAVELHVRVYGLEHIQTLLAMNSMAGVLEAQDRAEEAEPLRRHCAEHIDGAVPTGHALRYEFRSYYGQCLTKLGRFAEAESLLLGGFEGLRASQGDAHPTTRSALLYVIDFYRATGDEERFARYSAML